MDLSKIAAAGSAKSQMIYHENMEVLHVNTLEKHNYFIPFAKGQNAFDSREMSAKVKTFASLELSSIQTRARLSGVSRA